MLKILSTGFAAMFLMTTALSTPTLAHGGGGGASEERLKRSVSSTKGGREAAEETLSALGD